MMKNDSLNSPWEDVGEIYPKGRRLDIENEFFYVSRDAQGSYLLLATLPGVICVHQLPSLKGIDTKLVDIIGGNTALVLSLQNSENLDKFETISRDLAEYTKGLKGNAFVRSAVARLASWSKFIGPKKVGMGEAALVGLWGELYALNSFIYPVIGGANSVESWLGPAGGKQDFVANKFAVEVKTHRSGFSDGIEITSLEQLDSDVSNLFLLRLSISVSDNENSQSVLDLVSGFLDQEEIDLVVVDRYLSQYGSRVIEASEAELNKSYELTSVKLYRVDDNFPKLTREDISPCIDTAKYSINPERIKEFLIDKDVAEVLHDS